MKNLVLKALEWLLILGATFVVLAAFFGRPSTEPPTPDGQENLATAYNLRHYGVFSMDRDRSPETLQPSRYREPLPVFVLAAYMYAADPLLRDQPLSALMEGENVRVLKYSNAIWSALLVIMMVLTMRTLGLPAWAVAMAVLVAYAPLDNYHDTLYSDIAAAALIAMASHFCLRAVQTKRGVHFLGAGISFGLLILSKTAFLYVAIPLLLIYVGCVWIQEKDRAAKRSAFLKAAVVAAGTLAVVAPWMLRNQIQFGDPQLSDRGGMVLMTRAVKNGMTSEEYAGAFYAYAPRTVKKIMEKVTAYKPEDVEAGGRLEHLERAANRSHDRQALAEGRYDEIISYHWSIWGMHAAKLTAFRSTEHPDPYGATDAELKKEAIAMIKAHPLDHLVMTLPFIWRGAPFLFPLLLYTLYYAWRRHEASLAAYVLPSLGLIMFHALLSHFIPRYAISNVPIGAICFVLLLHRWVASRNRTTRSGETTQSTIRSA